MAKVNVATVETETTRWVKAIAYLDEDHLRVTDRNGRTLLDVAACQQEMDPGEPGSRGLPAWYFVDHDGVVATVWDMPGVCGCGGTRTEAISQVS